MFLGGLWHGASYNFVIWGSLHGAYLILQRLAHDLFKRMPHRPTPAPAALRVLRGAIEMAGVYALVLLAWVFFRIADLSDAIGYIQGILAWDNPFLVHGLFSVMEATALILATVCVDAVFIKRRRVVRLLRHPLGAPVAIAVLACAIQLFGSFGGGAFIYFQF
jgi:D-alanyl-lipoteichoic acid acyltransferase DltB (MBOAT superfamily)